MTFRKDILHFEMVIPFSFLLIYERSPPLSNNDPIHKLLQKRRPTMIIYYKVSIKISIKNQLMEIFSINK
jgi:hypothetical protein